MTTRTAEHEFFTEIKAAGLNRGGAPLDHLWGLYLTFKRLTKRGYQVRLVGHFRHARLVIEGGQR